MSAPVKGRLDVDAAGVVDAAATVLGDDAVLGRALVAGVTAAAATVPGVTVAAVTVLAGGATGAGVTVLVGPLGTTQPPGSVIDWVGMHWAPATAGIDNSDTAATNEPTTAVLIHFIVSNFP